MSRFTLPRDVYHGAGSLEELKNLKGKKAILVVGGGSMKRQGFLDKAVNHLKEAGMAVEVFEELCIPFNFPTLRQKAKFCAIPTTSGTATEVTAFSVITNYQTGVKYPLADFNITSDVAIVDPELAVGDACTGSNPRAIDPAAMEKLFTCTYYGTEVDF